jgi:hypothetical protein
MSIMGTTGDSMENEVQPLNDSVVVSPAKRRESLTDDIHLTNASKVGTALLATNAQRGLILM